MSKYTERENSLLKALNSKKRLDIGEVVRLLKISDTTARRLFIKLETRQKLIRVLGGISVIPENRFDYSFDISEQKYTREKTRIGAAAAELVKDGTIVFIESGTTILRLALSLKERLLNKTLKDITIVTNSLVNLEALGSSCKLISTGGNYRDLQRDFTGYLSEKAVQNLRYDICFLGTSGIHPREGFMTIDADSARLVETVISRSDKCVILADSSKFSQSSFISFATFEKVNQLITDNNLTGELLDRFKDNVGKITLV